jgi:hypothetical protein
VWLSRGQFVAMAIAIAMEARAERPSLAELKVEELLNEVRVEYPSEEAVASVVSAFRHCFQQIPDHEVSSEFHPSLSLSLGPCSAQRKREGNDKNNPFDALGLC